MDPINPNVDPLIYRNVGLARIRAGAALEKAGKEGIINGEQYTYWWEGAMAWAGWWHNMLGLLTEVASVRSAILVEQAEGGLQTQPPAAAGGEACGVDAGRRRHDRPSADTQIPCGLPASVAGRTMDPARYRRLRLIATFGLLETTANCGSNSSTDFYTVGKRQVEAGKKGTPMRSLSPATRRTGLQ